MNPNESPDTYKARQRIKKIYREQAAYEIEEEVPLTTVTNNIEEEIWPPYKADILLKRMFIIELDSKKLHGTRRKIIHDKWRDDNVFEQVNLKTVRLLSKDILHQTDEEILQEIDYQLKNQKK